MEFSISFLESFIWADAWVLIPVLYFIGMFLEQTPKVPEWTSPWILTVIGVSFCVINYGLIIQAVVQGILAAGAAVMLKELIQKPIQAAQNNLNHHYNQINNQNSNGSDQIDNQEVNDKSDYSENRINPGSNLSDHQEPKQDSNQNHN